MFLVVAAVTHIEMQMKVPSTVTPQTLVHWRVHLKVQNFPILNVLHCSHYHHSLTGPLPAGHSDARFVKVVARREFDCFPSALPVVIWAVMALMPSGLAFVA